MPRNEQGSGPSRRPLLSSRIGPPLLVAAVVLAAIAGVTFAVEESGWAWLALALAGVLAVLGAVLATMGRDAS